MLHIAIAKHLAAVVPDLTYDDTAAGGNLFVLFMPDLPDIAVGVFSAAGQPQPTRLATDLPGIQLRHRAGRHDPRPAYAMARLCYAELTCLDGITLDPGGDDEVRVVGCTAVQTDPIPLGPDPKGRPEFTLNYTLRVKAPTTHRPATT